MPDEITFQNDPVDPSVEFRKQHNHFFVAERAERVDPDRAAGELLWKRMSLAQRVSYHQVTLQLEDYAVWRDMPEEEYLDEQAFPFALDFISPRCVRLRVAVRPGELGDGDSLMLERSEPGEPWEREDDRDRTTWRGVHGSVSVWRDPWAVELRDAHGRILTRTHHHTESPGVVNVNPMPLCYVRSASSFHRHLAAGLLLSPGERLYGGGESFTRLDKRGQLLHMWTRDSYSAQTSFMYKPVPFVLSNRGWAVFAHTAAPATFDLGRSHDGAAVLYLADDVADLFLFLGEPKEVVSEYTALTGRARMPPRWSFGLWMGRDTYESADEVRSVARRLRAERVPCDVLHVDTAWTESKFRMDFEFSRSRFPEPERFLDELGDQGFRLSLWQFPYLHPRNDLHTEAVAKEYVVLASDGQPPVDDAVIDLTNDEAVEWYQAKLRRLLEQGVAVFTSDFGEAAPVGGIYRGDSAGFVEHNLYPPPLRAGRGGGDRGGDRRERAARPGRLGRVAAPPASLLGRSGDERRRHARHAARRPVTGPLRVHLLDPLRGRLPEAAGSRPLPALARVRRALLARPLPRRPAARAVGVRRRLPGSIPAPRRAALFAAAVRDRAGRGCLLARSPAAPAALLRVPW